ncbi:Cocaine esterase [Legionella santicrucis]|uniref:Cocaine esterase n=1 Tax=Legionella santicrucis TaxID=45074 RepID=A0A0W0YA74_9GAMM|nr:CocE/NonD family hydrolase [Legionella santicrucis]KTD53833.1 Cocaine esterase [Legionella santicrucis]
MKIREINHIFIPLADGCKLAAKIWLPEQQADLPVPVILEYLPYRKRDGTAIRDQITHPFLAAQGYACIRVDLRGSGESDGLLSDEYTKQEQDDCLEVLNWIEKQPWCNGKIGMMGISWGGFNALQVAARRPPNLHAIISLCSTDNRYTDDIHYMGGCLLNDNFQWSATMSAMMSRPPDKDLLGENWRQTWLNRLEHQTLLASTWLQHPQYDSYWKQGSICEDWSAIQCPVYLIGGWADGYTNTIPRMLESLQSPRKGLIGPWAHKYPHFGKPGPQIGFLNEALRWWDKWLKGIETGIMDEPMYRVWMQDSILPAPYYETRPGRWVAENQWPSNNIQAKQLFFANTNQLKDLPYSFGNVVYGTSPQSVGETAGAWCGYGMSPEKPIDQRLDDARSICFDSEPLSKPVEILGSPIVDLELTVDKREAFIAVRLNEVFPDGSSARVSYGLLNLSHQKNNEEVTPIQPGEKIKVSVPLKNVAHSFAPGNRIRLSISTNYWPLAWPSPAPVRLGILTGTSSLSLPVRTPSEEDKHLTAFGHADGAPPLDVIYFRPASGQRTVERNLGDNTVIYTVIEDSGDMLIKDIGLRTDYIQKEKYSIRDDDPLSAKINIETTIVMSRDEWKTKTITQSEMRGDETYYYLNVNLEAYENNTLIASRKWDEKIPRVSAGKSLSFFKPVATAQEDKSYPTDYVNRGFVS